MSDELNGRVAIVTGGARGIGAALTEMLVAQGASVVVADSGVGTDGRDPDPTCATEFAARHGAAAIAFTDDIATPAAAAALVARAVAQFGGVDIVINNAAILRDAFIFKGTAEDWDTVIGNNLSAAYYLLAAATPVMRDQAKAGRGGGEYRWARIVNLVSTAAYYGNYGQSSYASAKGGLTALTRVVALDMARSHVTCNAVAPFAHSRVTEMIQPANEAQASYKERGLRISPRHVANLVAWLVSDAACDVSGQIFGVRGREVFIFSQPRPVARVVSADGDWDTAALAAAVDRELKDRFSPLETDLEVFNTEPFV